MAEEMKEEAAALVPAPPSALVPAGSGLYQIDYRVDDVGKIFKKSKKSVTWQFGISNETHEVQLIWSKRTGKQYIEMDGSEVDNSRQKGASIVTHQWTTADGMALHVIASRASVKSIPNLQKYELMINGHAFTSLPFEDGTASPDVTSIVEILYPDGYDPDKFKNDPLPAIQSTVDEYKSALKLGTETTARRPVRHDGTAR